MPSLENVERARVLLDSGIDSNIPYAALEIRFAMEAIVYEKIRFHSPHLPTAIVDTWQPPQVLKLLVQLEPDAALDTITRIGPQSVDGARATVADIEIEHRSFTLAWLTKHYNVVGNLLHTPTIKQQLTSVLDWQLRRSQLNEILVEVKRVAESSGQAWLATIITYKCHLCGKDMPRNIDGLKTGTKVTCLYPKCGAEHVVSIEDGDQPAIDLLASDFDCLKCREPIEVEDRHVKIGLHFGCSKCQTQHEIAGWGYRMVEPSAFNSST